MKKRKEFKPYIVVLIKNEEEIPQYSLEYTSQKKAQETADYLNSTLTKQCLEFEQYVVFKRKEKKQKLKYYPKFDYTRKLMKIYSIDPTTVEKEYVFGIVKYKVGRRQYVEKLYDSVDEAIDSLGIYPAQILLPDGTRYR